MKSFLVIFITSCVISSVAAQTLLSHGLSCLDRQKFLDTHNNLRLKLAKGEVDGQPKASNMQKLVWDDILESTAQNWTDNMVFKHSAVRVHPNFTYVGENLAYGTNPKFDAKQAVELWFNEQTQFTYGRLTGPAAHAAGHYTQVAWAQTRYVGCGKTRFIHENTKTYNLYVCHYGPAGNFIGQFLYLTGPGCDDMCCKEQCDKPLYGSQCTESGDPIPEEED